MKMKKTFLSLLLVCSILCSSCSNAVYLEEGKWENDTPVVFEQYGITLESVRIEIIANLDENFKYDEFNAFTDDGGEYMRDANGNWIFYLYVDDVPLANLSRLTYARTTFHGGDYLLNDSYFMIMSGNLNKDSKNKTTYFELHFSLTPYYDGDPSNFNRNEYDNCVPSTVYLYEV